MTGIRATERVRLIRTRISRKVPKKTNSRRNEALSVQMPARLRTRIESLSDDLKGRAFLPADRRRSSLADVAIAFPLAPDRPVLARADASAFPRYLADRRATLYQLPKLRTRVWSKFVVSKKCGHLPRSVVGYVRLKPLPRQCFATACIDCEVAFTTSFWEPRMSEFVRPRT